MKNKIRVALDNELNEIVDPDQFEKTKKTRKPTLLSTKSKTRMKTIDYFELIYECIDKREKFLNIVSLDSRTSSEPDIDLAILQALLRGMFLQQLTFLI